MKNQKCGIYQIRCNRTGAIYIGSSKQIYTRWSQHRYYLRLGKSNCRYLQHAWTKHGEEFFQFSVLEECPVDELEQREQRYINALQPQFNSIVDIRRRYSPEGRAKMAAATRARAALVTNCPRGHPYNEVNTYLNKKGKRICRVCNAGRVSSVYASETPEQRELRRSRAKSYHERNRDKRLPKLREYGLTHKDRRRKYDLTHRAEINALRREHEKTVTPERVEQRRIRAKAYYTRTREERVAKMREYGKLYRQRKKGTPT